MGLGSRLSPRDVHPTGMSDGARGGAVIVNQAVLV